MFEKFPAFKNLLDADRVFAPRELLVEGDWLDTLADDWDLDVILSDLTLGNIAYDHRADFYRRVATCLAPGGIFIDRVLRHPGPHLSLAHLDKKYAHRPPNLQSINDFSSEYLFCSELLDGRTTVDSSHFYDYLASRFEDPVLTKHLAKSPLVTPRDCIWYYGKRWQTVEHDYVQDLGIRQIWDEPSSSVYYGRAQTLVSMRKARSSRERVGKA